MKKLAARKSCCILMSVTIAVAPVAYAADQEPLRTAQAIGEDPSTRPSAPKKTTKPTTTKTKPAPVTPAEPVAEKPATPEDAAAEPEVSKTAMYIGLGVAALLALGGGGGGGGGGGDAPATPPHPP